MRGWRMTPQDRDDKIDEALRYQSFATQQKRPYSDSERSYSRAAHRSPPPSSSYRPPQHVGEIQEARNDRVPDILDSSIANVRTFYRIAAELMDLYKHRNKTADQALETVMTAGQQKLFRRVLQDYMSKLPMFAEPGESSDTQLLRSVDSVFGRTLLDLETRFDKISSASVVEEGSTARGEASPLPSPYWQTSLPYQSPGRSYHERDGRVGFVSPSPSRTYRHDPSPPYDTDNYEADYYDNDEERRIIPSLDSDPVYSYPLVEDIQYSSPSAECVSSVDEEAAGPLKVDVDWNMVVTEQNLPVQTYQEEGAVLDKIDLESPVGNTDYGVVLETEEKSRSPTTLITEALTSPYQSNASRKSPGQNGNYKVDIASRKSVLILKRAEAESQQIEMQTILKEEIALIEYKIKVATDKTERAEYKDFLKDLKAEAYALEKNWGSGAGMVQGLSRLVEGHECGSTADFTSPRTMPKSNNLKKHSTSRNVTNEKKIVLPNNQSKKGRMVEVLAPGTLPEGFQFEARVDNEVFLATVPKGGVTKGQVFVSTMDDIYGEDSRRTREYMNMNSPQSRWRSGLLDCCRHGLNHPFALNSLLCPHVALSQIMARLRLSSDGNKKVSLRSRTRLCSIIGLTIVIILLHALYVSYFVFYSGDWTAVSISTLSLVALDGFLVLYFYCMVARTRYVVRQEYEIPDSCLGECCLAVCCTCCILTQMGYHTADYDTYRAYCCTDTGLSSHVEVRSPSDDKKRHRIASGVVG